MINVHLTDCVEETIVDLCKTCTEEFYDKTSERQGQSREGVYLLWEQFVKSQAVKVCKTWFDLQKTCYGKLMFLKSGQALKEMMEHQTWIQDAASINQQVMDHFIQMRIMLSLFLTQKWEITISTDFCNYLALELVGLEDKYFQIFRNKTVKLLSNIQSKADMVVSTSSHSSLNICARHFNSQSSQLQLQENTS